MPALWALGRIGGPEATECLLRWADGPSTLHRVEAFEALAHLKEKNEHYRSTWPRSAASPGRMCWTRGAPRRVKAALDHVLALGDESCRPALGRIAARHAAPAAWERECDARPAIGIAGGEAACGDATARHQIVRAIVRQGRELTAPAALVAEAERGGSINGYPTGFWTGYQIRQAEGNRRWHALDFALDYLAARPEVLDPLLRRVAADPTLPDAGRIVVLLHLHAAEPADLDSLEALWRRALGPGAPVAMIPVEAGLRRPRRRNASTSMPLQPPTPSRGCAPAHNWSDSGGSARPRIASCAGRSPWRPPAPIARLAPIVLEYVMRDWDAAARAGDAERRRAHAARSRATASSSRSATRRSSTSTTA